MLQILATSDVNMSHCSCSKSDVKVTFVQLTWKCRMSRVGLPSSKPKPQSLVKHDELLGNALEAFSKPRTRDAMHLAAMEEDISSQFIAGRDSRSLGQK